MQVESLNGLDPVATLQKKPVQKWQALSAVNENN